MEFNYVGMFNEFKDEKGNFKKALMSDVRGMLGVTPIKSCIKFLLACGSKTSLRQPFLANLVQQQSTE